MGHLPRGAGGNLSEMPWDVDGYVASLTAASPHTREAYERDARQFLQFLSEHLGGPPTLAVRAAIAIKKAAGTIQFMPPV